MDSIMRLQANVLNILIVLLNQTDNQSVLLQMQRRNLMVTTLISVMKVLQSKLLTKESSKKE